MVKADMHVKALLYTVYTQTIQRKQQFCKKKNKLTEFLSYKLLATLLGKLGIRFQKRAEKVTSVDS